MGFMSVKNGAECQYLIKDVDPCYRSETKCEFLECDPTDPMNPRLKKCHNNNVFSIINVTGGGQFLGPPPQWFQPKPIENPIWSYVDVDVI